MRRFVQAFGLKRDKHDHNQPRDSLKPLPANAPPAAKASLKALTLPFRSPSSSVTPSTSETATPAVHSPSSSSFSTPHLSSASTDPSSHSSGSSSTSASLSIQTPDDDHSPTLTRSLTKRSWKSWIGGKRSGSLKHRDRQDKDLADHQLPDWDPLGLPVTPSFLHPKFQVTGLTEDTDDEMHVSSVSDLDCPPPSDSSLPQIHTLPPPSPAAAKRNLRILINNNLIQPPHVAPFVQPASGPIFPHSCNRSRINAGRHSLHSVMLKKRLLRRIDDPVRDLTPLEQDSILPFGSQPTPVELSPSSLLEHDICYPDKTAAILSSCLGLRKWICRPCFEDRFAVYLPSNVGDVVCKPVSSSFAVAALEYPEVLDVMVDPDFELPSDKDSVPHLPSSPGEPVTTVKDRVASPPSLQAAATPSFNPRRNSHTSTPSPLRNEHNASDTVMSSDETSKQIAEIQPQQGPTSKKTVGVTSVKRVVRFVENDDDDGVPLHLLRMKKKREERAQFLRKERQRRMREALEEQQRKEAEAYEVEKKRIAKQKERQEREQRLYAEQVAASRQRSEQARAGAYALSSSSSSSLLVPPRTTSRESERNRPRGSPYSSPRREASEFGVHGSSSGGSRLSSRPPSTYSASSEETRPTTARRNSYTPSMSGSMRSMPSSMRTMTYSYPAAGSSPSLNGIPQMPQLAAFAAVNNDLPLLPPTAPFMKQHSTRQSSPGPDSRRGASSSRERRQSSSLLQSVSNRNLSNSSLRRETASPPNSPQRTDFRHSNHVRQSSGDSRNSKRSSATQPRPQPTTSQSQPHISRGRPPISVHHSSHYVQGANPWTALPTRNGGTPTAMPVSSYSHTSSRPVSGFVGPMGHDWRSTLIS